jgi:hypothetical protein
VSRPVGRVWCAGLRDLDRLAGGVLVRTVACPVPPEARPRLRGARPGTAQPPRLAAPLAVTRRVCVRGAIMAGGQRIQVAWPTPARPSR